MKGIGEMLVLSRKLGESIVINDNIVVHVIEIRGDKIRLGVDAPKDIPIHRKEIHERVKRGESKPVKKKVPVVVSESLKAWRGDYNDNS